MFESFLKMKTLPLLIAFSWPWPLSDSAPETVPLKRLVFEETVPHKRTNIQKGMASWYGKENSVSSTGKKLKHKTPALAHKTLPIGTVVKVTSIRTNRTVKAVVEDRGPYKKGRIVDLNYPAAKELGILKDGITKVIVEPVGKI